MLGSSELRIPEWIKDHPVLSHEILPSGVRFLEGRSLVWGPKERGFGSGLEVDHRDSRSRVGCRESRDPYRIGEDPTGV